MATDKRINVDCPKCGVRVCTEVEGYVLEPEVGDMGAVLSKCPECNGPLLSLAWLDQYDENSYSWRTDSRLWPEPSNRSIADGVPKQAARDLVDAHRCLQHQIYSAAVVLCGRALERLIKEHTKEKNLAKGLMALKEKGVIDEKLYNWSEMLRKERNVGAHASEHDISKQDATDVVDLAYAIFDYVYNLNQKYQEYLERKKTKATP